MFYFVNFFCSFVCDTKQCDNNRQISQNNKSSHVGVHIQYHQSRTRPSCNHFKMSTRKQLQQFDIDFVKSAMREWIQLSNEYEKNAGNIYKKLRSYLTLYQFRLNDSEKCDIREMLSQDLDEIEKVNIVEEMDSYLEGYCFQFDKSILPKRQPTEVKLQICPESETKTNHIPQNLCDSNTISASTLSDSNTISAPTDTIANSNSPYLTSFADDLDFYTYQFFQ